VSVILKIGVLKGVSLGMGYLHLSNKTFEFFVWKRHSLVHFMHHMRNSKMRSPQTEHICLVQVQVFIDTLAAQSLNNLIKQEKV